VGRLGRARRAEADALAGARDRRLPPARAHAGAHPGAGASAVRDLAGEELLAEASRIVGLVEHEYGEVVPGEDWKRLYEGVVDGALRAFYASPTFEEIRRTPRERWLSVDELDSWDFEGTKIWVAIDFAYREADGRVRILDWKTGKERGVDHTQVGIYALYAQRKWSAPPDAVLGGLVYLVANGAGAGGETVSVAADCAALERCQAEMRRSIGEMKATLADPARNHALIDRFPQHAERDGCRRCPFGRPCGRL
jgi:hypothetical protein